MRLHRFYVSTPINGKTFDISDRDLIHQWRSVFRYNVGSQVILFDGSGTDYLCIIATLRSSEATLTVIKETYVGKAGDADKKNVWLCMALVKKDNFELIAQKVTELGVTHIVPVLCEHSEKRKVNMERLQKIVIEASEQSGRGDVPVIEPTMSITELFEKGILPQEKIALHPTGLPFKKYQDTVKVFSIAVFIGPEGGFSPKELEAFKKYNMQTLSLGPQVLRAETAAIAVSSLLLL